LASSIEGSARLSHYRVSNSLGKTVKDRFNVSSTLHGDDSELILLINPGQEGFVLAVEDATTLWSISP
jgi:hypothetical protein